MVCEVFIENSLKRHYNNIRHNKKLSSVGFCNSQIMAVGHFIRKFQGRSGSISIVAPGFDSANRLSKFNECLRIL